jgi:hypothetical protein
MTDQVFNTRLTNEQIEKIRAYAYFKRTTIQAVTGAAVDQFFDERKDETEKALQEYRKRDESL